MGLNNFRTEHLIWDRVNSHITYSLETNSGDSNGRKLRVQVLDGGVVTALTGVTLSLAWKTGNERNSGLDAFKIVDAALGIFEIYYTTEMLSNVGKLKASLVLVDATGRMESDTFSITVNPTMVDDNAVQGENSFTALTEALISVTDLEKNYAPKLNEVTAQLAQTVEKSTFEQFELSTNQQLTQKVGGGNLANMSDMGQDVKEAMTGGSVAVVGRNAVTKENIVDKQVTLEKLAFTPVVGIPSKNIFDKDTVDLNKGLNSNTGQTFDAVGYFVSEYFIVSPQTAYHFEANGLERKIAFYSTNAPEGLLQTFYNTKAVTSPANARYARISGQMSQLSSAQVEIGTSYTGYESFLPKFNQAIVKDNSFEGSRLKDKTIPPGKMAGFKPSKNLFNKDSVTPDKFIAGNGTIGDNTSYVLSDFIPVPSGASIVANELQYSAYFDEGKTFLSGNGSGSLKTQATPNNVAWVRVSVPKAMSDTYQLEVGSVPTIYESYGYELQHLRVKDVTSTTSHRSRLYSFKDAWVAWENNEKFPVGFLGDSTTDGSNTTGWTDATRHEAQDLSAGGYGSVDYINEKAYPYLLEQLIKKETGKTAPRIYNIGYSGTYLEWAKPKLNDIFGGVYADVKMVGIVYGINDRTRVSTTLAYESMMRTNLEHFIHFFYDKGIQPFMVTSQATVEPYDQFEGAYPLRTSEDINSVANRVKRELANKYNLEIIEMTDFGEHVFSYSQYTLTELINDTLHFNDKGHELEAGFLFSRFCPRVITTKDSELLGFSSQRIKSFVPAKKGITLHYLNPFEDGFKVKADYTKADVNDMLMQDFWIMNYSKKQLELKAFLTDVHAQYVKLNGLNIVVDSNGKSLGNLDVGLHHIQAYSGQSTEVDFKGFTLS